MSKFVIKYDPHHDDYCEQEVPDLYAGIYNKYYDIIDAPSGLRRVEYMPDSPYLDKSKILDFGDNPVVISL